MTSTQEETPAGHVAGFTASGEFWASRPAWRPDVVSALLDGSVVIWVDDVNLALSHLASAVSPFLDGSATVLELAEDLAAVLTISDAAGRTLVGPLVAELADHGALVGVAPTTTKEPVAQEPPAIEDHELAGGLVSRPDDVIRVETETTSEGHQVTTEHLADGTRRITTVVDLGDQTSSAELALLGNRSPAQLVPADSCLGTKLRLADEARLVSVPVEGRVLRVRCGSDELAAAVAGRLGGSIDDDADVAIEAFLVPPLEGAGPPRVYDGRGQRRGRPRSAEEVAVVVEHVLAERSHQWEPGADPTVSVASHLIVGSRSALLVAPELLSAIRLEPSTRAAGWWAVPFRAEIFGTGQVQVPGLGARFDPVPALGLLRSEGAGAGEPSSVRALALLRGLAWTDPEDRRTALDVVGAFLAATPDVELGLGSCDDLEASRRLNDWLCQVSDR